MNKTVKIALFSIPVLVGIYFIYKQLRKPSSQPYTPPQTPEPPVTPVRTPVQVSSGCNFPLKKGVNNCDLVKKLQWALNHIPITSYDSRTGFSRPLAEDGDFGSKTEAALKAFWSGSNGEVQDQSDLDFILTYVVTDPVAFQAAENPYVMAPDNTYTPSNPNMNTTWENNPLNPLSGF